MPTWVAEIVAKITHVQKRKRYHDAMQSLEYEINTLFTSNGQTPFTSLGLVLVQTGLNVKFKKPFLLFVSKVLVANTVQLSS